MYNFYHSEMILCIQVQHGVKPLDLLDLILQITASVAIVSQLSSLLFWFFFSFSLSYCSILFLDIKITSSFVLKTSSDKVTNHHTLLGPPLVTYLWWSSYALVKPCIYHQYTSWNVMLFLFYFLFLCAYPALGLWSQASALPLLCILYTSTRVQHFRLNTLSFSHLTCSSTHTTLLTATAHCQSHLSHLTALAVSFLSIQLELNC